MSHSEDLRNISLNTKYISNISLIYSSTVMSSFLLVSLNVDASKKKKKA